MRIIAGTWRGKKLQVPPGNVTRPTADRARESLFNILTARFQRQGILWSDLTFCDVFAGSGAVGMEALSRGAKQCLFFEKDSDAFHVLLKNTAGIDRAILYKKDALLPPPAPKSVDVVFMDPPYLKNLWQSALEAFFKQGYIDAHTLVIVETDGLGNEMSPSGWILEQIRQSGRNRFLFLKRENEVCPLTSETEEIK